MAEVVSNVGVFPFSQATDTVFFCISLFNVENHPAKAGAINIIQNRGL